MIAEIHIILHIIYVAKSHSILKEYQSNNPINIAILKSPHHIQAQPLTIICKKKNIKIIKTHISAFIAGKSNKLILLVKKILNKYIKIHIHIRINISILSFNSFNIMKYNQIIDTISNHME